MLLTSATDKVRLVTAGGGAIAIDTHSSFVDMDGATNPPTITTDRKNGQITTATTTDIVDSPTGTKKRNVKLITVRNKHATDAVTVTVVHTDGTTAVEMRKEVLAAGQELQYTPTLGFLML